MRLSKLLTVWLLLAAPQLCWMTPSPSEAAPADAPPGDRARNEVARLIADLDSDRYEVRQRAVARLEQLVAEPGMDATLSREFQRVLVLPNTSFEVRKQLERLRRRLPKVAIPPDDRVSAEEIDRLVRQLDDDSYGARLAATKRLEWLLGNPKLTYTIMSRLKRQIAAAGLSVDARQSLEPIYERARGAWLTGDPDRWSLPPVPAAQIARWIEDLARTAAPMPGPALREIHQTAARELRDVLARDAEVPKVKQALEARLADKTLTLAAAARLRELVDLTRPAMVAEYWEGRRHVSTQHLLIGVPSMTPMQERPSHFDRIDDQAAHCVSGQNLSPGDYPVGVAIPHPKRDGAMFHLVNLSTPRRRMAYQYQAQRDQSTQLAALSRRTLDRLFAQKSPLSEKELNLLEQLDANEVSRFAGKFFHLVADQPLPAEGIDPTAPRPSRHGALCALLAAEGTREAIPGLLKAIEANRFLPPTPAAPYELSWLAALSIAARDPWPDVDAWLPGLIGRSTALVQGHANPPELGATAAAILLKRHRQDPAKFGLEPVPDETFKELGLSGYRFASPESRQQVRQWWEQRKKST